MSSLWVHMMGKDFYSYFDTLEEAYFTAKNIVKNPVRYVNMISWLNDHSTAMIDSEQTLQVVIYKGHRKPPVSNNYFPYGLMYVEKQNIVNHI